MITQREFNARRYKDHRDRGLCVYCDQPHEPGRIRCKLHRQIAAYYNAGIRDIRIAKGLCVYCGKNKTTKYKACLPCREKRAEWNSRQYRKQAEASHAEATL